jgi:hypothetical protein
VNIDVFCEKNDSSRWGPVTERMTAYMYAAAGIPY